MMGVTVMGRSVGSGSVVGEGVGVISGVPLAVGVGDGDAVGVWVGVGVSVGVGVGVGVGSWSVSGTRVSSVTGSFSSV